MREITTIQARLSRDSSEEEEEEEFDEKVDEKYTTNTDRPSYSKTSQHDEQTGTFSYNTQSSHPSCTSSSFWTRNLENRYNPIEEYRVLRWNSLDRLRNLIQNQFDKVEGCNFANFIADNTVLVQNSAEISDLVEELFATATLSENHVQVSFMDIEALCELGINQSQLTHVVNQNSNHFVNREKYDVKVRLHENVDQLQLATDNIQFTNLHAFTLSTVLLIQTRKQTVLSMLRVLFWTKQVAGDGHVLAVGRANFTKYRVPISKLRDCVSSEDENQTTECDLAQCSEQISCDTNIVWHEYPKYRAAGLALTDEDKTTRRQTMAHSFWHLSTVCIRRNVHETFAQCRLTESLENYTFKVAVLTICDISFVYLLPLYMLTILKGCTKDAVKQQQHHRKPSISVSIELTNLSHVGHTKSLQLNNNSRVNTRVSSGTILSKITGQEWSKKSRVCRNTPNTSSLCLQYLSHSRHFKNGDVKATAPAARLYCLPTPECRGENDSERWPSTARRNKCFLSKFLFDEWVKDNKSNSQPIKRKDEIDGYCNIKDHFHRPSIVYGVSESSRGWGTWGEDSRARQSISQGVVECEVDCFSASFKSTLYPKEDSFQESSRNNKDSVRSSSVQTRCEDEENLPRCRTYKSKQPNFCIFTKPQRSLSDQPVFHCRQHFVADVVCRYHTTNGSTEMHQAKCQTHHDAQFFDHSSCSSIPDNLSESVLSFRCTDDDNACYGYSQSASETGIPLDEQQPRKKKQRIGRSRRSRRRRRRSRSSNRTTSGSVHSYFDSLVLGDSDSRVKSPNKQITALCAENFSPFFNTTVIGTTSRRFKVMRKNHRICICMTRRPTLSKVKRKVPDYKFLSDSSKSVDRIRVKANKAQKGFYPPADPQPKPVNHISSSTLDRFPSEKIPLNSTLAKVGSDSLTRKPSKLGFVGSIGPGNEVERRARSSSVMPTVEEEEKLRRASVTESGGQPVGIQSVQAFSDSKANESIKATAPIANSITTDPTMAGTALKGHSWNSKIEPTIIRETNAITSLTETNTKPAPSDQSDPENILPGTSSVVQLLDTSKLVDQPNREPETTQGGPISTETSMSVTRKSKAFDSENASKSIASVPMSQIQTEREHVDEENRSSPNTLVEQGGQKTSMDKFFGSSTTKATDEKPSSVPMEIHLDSVNSMQTKPEKISPLTSTDKKVPIVILPTDDEEMEEEQEVTEETERSSISKECVLASKKLVADSIAFGVNKLMTEQNEIWHSSYSKNISKKSLLTDGSSNFHHAPIKKDHKKPSIKQFNNRSDVGRSLKYLTAIANMQKIPRFSKGSSQHLLRKKAIGAPLEHPMDELDLHETVDTSVSNESQYDQMNTIPGQEHDYEPEVGPMENESIIRGQSTSPSFQTSSPSINQPSTHSSHFGTGFGVWISQPWPCFTFQGATTSIPFASSGSSAASPPPLQPLSSGYPYAPFPAVECLINVSHTAPTGPFFPIWSNTHWHQSSCTDLTDHYQQGHSATSIPAQSTEATPNRSPFQNAQSTMPHLHQATQVAGNLYACPLTSFYTWIRVGPWGITVYNGMTACPPSPELEMQLKFEELISRPYESLNAEDKMLLDQMRRQCTPSVLPNGETEWQSVSKPTAGIKPRNKRLKDLSAKTRKMWSEREKQENKLLEEFGFQQKVTSSYSVRQLRSNSQEEELNALLSKPRELLTTQERDRIIELLRDTQTMPLDGPVRTESMINKLDELRMRPTESLSVEEKHLLTYLESLPENRGLRSDNKSSVKHRRTLSMEKQMEALRQIPYESLSAEDKLLLYQLQALDQPDADISNKNAYPKMKNEQSKGIQSVTESSQPLDKLAGGSATARRTPSMEANYRELKAKSKDSLPTEDRQVPKQVERKQDYSELARTEHDRGEKSTLLQLIPSLTLKEQQRREFDHVISSTHMTLGEMCANLASLGSKEDLLEILEGKPFDELTPAERELFMTLTQSKPSDRVQSMQKWPWALKIMQQDVTKSQLNAFREIMSTTSSYFNTHEPTCETDYSRYPPFIPCPCQAKYFIDKTTGQSPIICFWPWPMGSLRESIRQATDSFSQQSSIINSYVFQSQPSPQQQTSDKQMNYHLPGILQSEHTVTPLLSPLGSSNVIDGEWDEQNQSYNFHHNASARTTQEKNHTSRFNHKVLKRLTTIHNSTNASSDKSQSKQAIKQRYHVTSFGQSRRVCQKVDDQLHPQTKFDDQTTHPHRPLMCCMKTICTKLQSKIRTKISTLVASTPVHKLHSPNRHNHTNSSLSSSSVNTESEFYDNFSCANHSSDLSEPVELLRTVAEMCTDTYLLRYYHQHQDKISHLQMLRQCLMQSCNVNNCNNGRKQRLEHSSELNPTNATNHWDIDKETSIGYKRHSPSDQSIGFDQPILDDDGRDSRMKIDKSDKSSNSRIKQTILEWSDRTEFCDIDATCTELFEVLQKRKKYPQLSFGCCSVPLLSTAEQWFHIGDDIPNTRAMRHQKKHVEFTCDLVDTKRPVSMDRQIHPRRNYVSKSPFQPHYAQTTIAFEQMIRSRFAEHQSRIERHHNLCINMPKTLYRSCRRTYGKPDDKNTFKFPVSYKRSWVCCSTQCTPQDINKRPFVKQKQTAVLVDSATSTEDLDESYYVLNHHQPQTIHPANDNKGMQTISSFQQENFQPILGTRYLKFISQLRPQLSKSISHKVAQCKHQMPNANHVVIVPREISEGNVSTTSLASELIRAPSKVLRKTASIQEEQTRALIKTSHTVNLSTERTMPNVEEFIDDAPRLFEALISEFHGSTNGMQLDEKESSFQPPRHALQCIHAVDKPFSRIKSKVTETRATQTSAVSHLRLEVPSLDTDVNETNMERIAPIQSFSNSLLIMPTTTQPNGQATFKSTNQGRVDSGETKLWNSRGLKNSRRKSRLNEITHGDDSQEQCKPKSLRKLETLTDELAQSKELMETVEKLLCLPKATTLHDQLMRTQNVIAFQTQNGDKNDPLLKAILILIEQYRQSALTATGSSLESNDGELPIPIAPSTKPTHPEPEMVTPLVLRSTETTAARAGTSQVEAARKYPLKSSHVKISEAKQQKTIKQLRDRVNNDVSVDSAGSELILSTRIAEASDSEGFNPLKSNHVLKKGPLINPGINPIKQPRLDDPIKKRNPLNLIVGKSSDCVCSANVLQSRKLHMQCTQNRHGNREGLLSESDSDDDSPYPEDRHTPKSEASELSFDLGTNSTTISLSGSMSSSSCDSPSSETLKHFKPERPPCAHLLYRNVYMRNYLHTNQSPILSACGPQTCGVQTSPVITTVLRNSLQQPFDCVEQHQTELTEASPVNSEIKPISHTNTDRNPKELCICTMRAPIFPNQFSESEPTNTVAPTPVNELRPNIGFLADYQQTLKGEIEKCWQQAQNPENISNEQIELLEALDALVRRSGAPNLLEDTLEKLQSFYGTDLSSFLDNPPQLTPREQQLFRLLTIGWYQSLRTDECSSSCLKSSTEQINILTSTDPWKELSTLYTIFLLAHRLRSDGMQLPFFNSSFHSKQTSERSQSHVDEQQKPLTIQPKYEENNPSADSLYQHFFQFMKQFKLERNQMPEDHSSNEIESTMSKYKTVSTQHNDKLIASTKWHCSKKCKRYIVPELRKISGLPELASKEVQTEEGKKAGRQSELNPAVERLRRPTLASVVRRISAGVQSYGGAMLKRAESDVGNEISDTIPQGTPKQLTVHKGKRKPRSKGKKASQRDSPQRRLKRLASEPVVVIRKNGAETLRGLFFEEYQPNNRPPIHSFNHQRPRQSRHCGIAFQSDFLEAAKRPPDKQENQHFSFDQPIYPPLSNCRCSTETLRRLELTNSPIDHQCAFKESSSIKLVSFLEDEPIKDERLVRSAPFYKKCRDRGPVSSETKCLMGEGSSSPSANIIVRLHSVDRNQHNETRFNLKAGSVQHILSCKCYQCRIFSFRSPTPEIIHPSHESGEQNDSGLEECFPATNLLGLSPTHSESSTTSCMVDELNPEQTVLYTAIPYGNLLPSCSTWTVGSDQETAAMYTTQTHHRPIEYTETDNVQCEPIPPRFSRLKSVQDTRKIHDPSSGRTSVLFSRCTSAYTPTSNSLLPLNRISGQVRYPSRHSFPRPWYGGLTRTLWSTSSSPNQEPSYCHDKQPEDRLFSPVISTCLYSSIPSLLNCVFGSTDRMDHIRRTEVPSSDPSFAHRKVRNGPRRPCSVGSSILNPEANSGFGSGDKVQTLCINMSQVDSERNSNESPSTDTSGPDIQTENISPVNDVQVVMRVTSSRKQGIRSSHEKNRLSNIRKNKKSIEASGKQWVQMESKIGHFNSHKEQTGCLQTVETELESILLEVGSRCKSAPSSTYRRKRDISSSEVKPILKANCLKPHFLNHFQLNITVPTVNMQSYHLNVSCSTETKLPMIQCTGQEGSDNQNASKIPEHAIYLKDRPANRKMPPTHFQKFIRPSSEQRKTKNLRHNLEVNRQHNLQPTEKQTSRALRLKANRQTVHQPSIKPEYVKPVRKTSLLNELLINVCSAVDTEEQLDPLKTTFAGSGQLHIEPSASNCNPYLATGVKYVNRELGKHRERCECESRTASEGYHLMDYPLSFLDGNTHLKPATKYPEHAAMEDDQDTEVKALDKNSRPTTHYQMTEQPNIQRGTCNRSSSRIRSSLQHDNELIEVAGSSDGFDRCGSNGINEPCMQCRSSNKISTVHHLFNGSTKTDQRLQVISLLSQDNTGNSTSISNTIAFYVTRLNSSDVTQKYNDEDDDKNAISFTCSKVDNKTLIYIPEETHLVPYHLYSEPVHHRMKCQDSNSDCVIDQLNFYSPFSYTHIALGENIERHDDCISAKTQFDLNSWNNCNHPGRYEKQIPIDDTDCKSAQTTEMYTSQAHRDLLCILVHTPRDDTTQSANASNKPENSTVMHNFAQDTVQTFPAVNNLVDYAQKIAGIKGVQWFSVVGALTTNEREQLSTRPFWIRTNVPQPTIQPSCSIHVQATGEALQYNVQSTLQNDGAKDCTVVKCDDPQFKIQSADSTTFKTTNQYPQNEILSPTITLKANKILEFGLSSSSNLVQLCPTDLNVRLLLDVKFPLKSDTTNESLHSTTEKCLLPNVKQLDNKQTNFPSNTDPSLQREKPCKQNPQQDEKHSKESNDSLDYASESPITSIRTISLTLSVANPPENIRDELDSSFISGKSVTIVDTPPTVSSVAPTVDSLRKSVKNSEHTFGSNMPKGYANQPEKIGSELCAGMAQEKKNPSSPKEIPVDYSLSSTSSKETPEYCMLTDMSKSATSCVDVPNSDSPANVATPPYVSDFKNLVLEQNTKQAVRSPGEEAKIEPNVTNRTSPTLITTELYYSRVNWLPNIDDPAFSHISYTQGAAYCVPDQNKISNLSNLLLQHYTSAEALCNWLDINPPRMQREWNRKPSPMTTSMRTVNEHNDRTQPKSPSVMHQKDNMTVFGKTKHSYTAQTNNGLSPHERINDFQILNAVEKDTEEYRTPLLTPDYGWFPNKQINLPTSPSSLEHQPTLVSTPTAEPPPNEKSEYSSTSRKLGKDLLNIFENRPAMNKPSEGNLSVLTETDRSSSRLQKAPLAPTSSEFSSDKCSLNIPNPPVATQHAISEIQSAKLSEKLSKNNLSNFTKKTTDYPYVIRTTPCSQTLSSKSSSGFLGTPPKSPRRRWPSSRPQKPSQSENTSLADLTEKGDPVTNKRALFTRSVMYTYSRRMCTRLFPATVDPQQINRSVTKPTETCTTFGTQRPQSAPTGTKQYSGRTVVEHSPLEASIEQLDSDCSQRETSVKAMPNPPHDTATILTCLGVANMATVTITTVVDNLSELVKQLKTLVHETKIQQIPQRQIGNWAYWNFSISSDISLQYVAGSQRIPVDQQQATLINSSKLNNSIDRALQTENFHSPVTPGSNVSKRIHTQTSSVNVGQQADSAQTNQLLSNYLQITTKLETQNTDGQLDDSVCRNRLHMSNKITPIISVSADLNNVTQTSLRIGVDCSSTVPCHNVELNADHNTVSHLLLCRPIGYDPDWAQSKRTYTPNVEAFKVSINKCTEIPDRLQRLDTDLESQMLRHTPVSLSVTTHLVPKYMSEKHKSKIVNEVHVCLRALLAEGEEDYIAAPDDGLSGVKRIVNARHNLELKPQQDPSLSSSTVTHSRVEYDLSHVQRDRTTRKTEPTTPLNLSYLQTENVEQHTTFPNFQRGSNSAPKDMTTKPDCSANPSLERIIDLRHQPDNDHRTQKIDSGYTDMPATSSVKNGCSEKDSLSTSKNKWISLAGCLDENTGSAQHTDSNSDKRGKSPKERTMTAFANSHITAPDRRVVTNSPQSEHSNKAYTFDRVSPGSQENASLDGQFLDQYCEETFLLNEAMEVDLDVLDRLTRLWIGGTREMGPKSAAHHIPTRRPDTTNKQNNAAYWHSDPKSILTITSDFACNRLSRSCQFLSQSASFKHIVTNNDSSLRTVKNKIRPGSRPLTDRQNATKKGFRSCAQKLRRLKLRNFLVANCKAPIVEDIDEGGKLHTFLCKPKTFRTWPRWPLPACKSYPYNIHDAKIRSPSIGHISSSSCSSSQPTNLTVRRNRCANKHNTTDTTFITGTSLSSDIVDK